MGTPRRRLLLWATPVIVALFAAAYSIDHHARRAPRAAPSTRAEVLAHGSGTISGTLLGPDGSPVDEHVEVHLVTETWLAAHNPATWRCCRDCELSLFDAYCELSSDVVARLFTRRELDVMPARTAHTDGGEFAFDELPAGVYAVFASAPRGTLAVARDVTVIERGDTHVVLASHFASTLAGTVLSAETARAVEGADVVVVDPRIGRSHVAKTDAEGRFVVAGLDPDVGYQLTALAEDFAPSERSNLWVGEDEELVELQVGATIAGTLRLNGAPAEGVVVDLDDGIDGLVTPKSGRFSFARLSPGIHVVRAATREGFGARIEVDLSAGDTLDRTFELEPVRALEVSVVDTATRSITGVDVRLKTPREQERRVERTDERGRAIFDLVPTGPVALEVKRADLGAVSTTATITAGAGPVRITTRLEGTAGVRGRITDGRGRAVADVELTLEHLSPTSDSGDDVPRGGFTDVKGTFAIPSLTPGAWELTAKKSGYITARSSFNVEERDVPVDVDLVLVEGGQIRGHVVDPDGRGEGGWIVRAVPKYPSEAARELAPDDLSQGTVSDRDGAFVLVGLEPGPHVLSARPAPPSSRRIFESSVTETHTVEATTGTNDVVLHTPGKGTLTGRVRFGGGGSPEAIEVTVPGAGVRSFDGRAGRFTFDDAPAGTYPIRVRAPGFGAEVHRVTVTRGEVTQVDVPLARAARLTGRLVDEARGEAVSGALVVATATTSAGRVIAPARRTVSRRDGRFSFANLLEGDVMVSIEARGYGTTQHGPFVASPGGRAELELVLARRTAAVSGQVHRAAEAVRDAEVALLPIEGGSGVVTTSGELGAFTIDAAPLGRHLVQVTTRAPDTGTLVTWRRAVTLAPEGIDALDVDLADRGGELRLVVEVPRTDDTPVAVRLRRAEGAGRETHVLAKDQTRITFDGLAPGAWIVERLTLDGHDVHTLSLDGDGTDVVATKELDLTAEETTVRLR